MSSPIDRRPTREELLAGEWTYPRENCPRDGAQLLVNIVGVKWCSLVGCDYVAPAPSPSPARLAGDAQGVR